jgi:multisubunit Na+/H+ antiporter MnhC subunit
MKHVIAFTVYLHSISISILLVGETTGGGFETLGGDKTQSFISRTEAYRSKNKHKSLIHALSLSL